jgi:hypothetical protein
MNSSETKVLSAKFRILHLSAIKRLHKPSYWKDTLTYKAIFDKIGNVEFGEFGLIWLNFVELDRV